MKPGQLKNKLLIFVVSALISMVYSQCGDDVEGTYYLSDEAKIYMFDTTISNFKVQDNHGITEEFYIDKNNWYTDHHYFMEWGDKGKAFGEMYGIAYHSSLNDYFFTWVMRAGIETTFLEFEWNQKDRFYYLFATKEFTSDLKPDILFFDSLVVDSVVYKDIIKIDCSAIKDKTDFNTPEIFFFSGNNGLVKFIRKDGIVVNRVE